MARKTRWGDKTRRRMFLELAAMSDSELVSLAEKGSPEAFQVLVDRYGPLVRSIAAKFLAHDSMALEDSYQETILKALTKLGDLDDKSKFKSWLCTIARNQALDAARKRTVMVSWEREGDDGDPIHWEIADLKANPAEAQAQAEVESIMRDVLREIPDMYRRPIAMRFEEGLDYSEIAVELRKPLGTVKSLIHRGKLLIKEKVTRRAWGIEGAHVLASL